jgi:LacI family transcriptional regulator
MSRARTSRSAPRVARPATVVDVAREAGVSVASVSRVVNGHANVSPETRARVEQVVERLRYVPHTAARSLATKRSQLIGVLLPDLHGDFFSELIRGIDAAARSHQLHLLLSSSHGDADEMAEAIRAMHGRVEGMIILAPHLEAARIRAFHTTTPTVFVNSPVAPGTSPVLAIDGYNGARAMVRHLAARHTAIVHVAGPDDNFDAHERERGYRDELAARVRGARPHVVRGDFSEAAGRAAARTIAALSPRPTAVFAANDMMAIGCLSGFTELGLSVPRDIAVTGFDDIPLASYVRPALTTMRVEIYELGRAAVARLTAVLADKRPAPITSLTPELVVRESCGADQPSPRRSR